MCDLDVNPLQMDYVSSLRKDFIIKQIVNRESIELLSFRHCSDTSGSSLCQGDVEAVVFTVVRLQISIRSTTN